MRAVLLIAINFVREQRWPIFVLLLWVLLLAFLGLVTDIHRDRDDLLFIFKQVAVYVVVFSVFFGGSALYNERKSRRILAVLSKAVGRPQYLSGLVLGVILATAIYCFSLGLTGSWTLGQTGFPVSQIWYFMLCLTAASALAGTVALMFSTFLNPFFAAGATSLVLLLPALASHFGAHLWGYVIPAGLLMEVVLNSSFKDTGSMHWLPIGWACVETVLIWILAGQIFTRVDIAVAVD